MREATPYQQPAPLAEPAVSAPPTRVLPPAAPSRLDGQQPWMVPPERPSRSQQLLQLLGLGALTSALVGYAPYAGTALVAVLVLLLRTASVTRQRHGRRRLIRGRPRWYDVPTTTLSMPGYLLLALFGALMVVAAAVFSGVALFSLAYLLGQPLAVGMLMAGLGFTPALWWGPGSGRVREVTRGLVARTARSEFGGWFVVAMCALGTAVLVGLLLSGGPNWAPQVSAPWR